jgi:hypothetical protein
LQRSRLNIQLVVHRKKDGGHPSAAIHLRNAIKRMYGYANCDLNEAAAAADAYA